MVMKTKKSINPYYLSTRRVHFHRLKTTINPREGIQKLRYLYFLEVCFYVFRVPIHIFQLLEIALCLLQQTQNFFYCVVQFSQLYQSILQCSLVNKGLIHIQCLFYHGKKCRKWQHT